MNIVGTKGIFKNIFSRIEGETWTDKSGRTWMYHEGTPDEPLDYDVNENLPERATFRAYKMFRTEYNPNDPKTYKYKGLLFPLYINAKNGYEIGRWYKAGKGSFRILVDENGEPILDSSGNPTCKTIEKDLAYRPGLHMGSLPLMRHRGRQDYPHQGNKDFDAFHSQEVFAEVEYAGNYDYTEKSQEKMRNSANPNDPYEAGFSDTKDFENGYYRFKTNVHASDEEAWLIADAMKIIRVIPDSEVEKIISESGTTLKPQIRGEPNGKEGDMFMADFTQFNIQSGVIMDNVMKGKLIKSEYDFEITDEGVEYDTKGYKRAYNGVDNGWYDDEIPDFVYVDKKGNADMNDAKEFAKNILLNVENTTSVPRSKFEELVKLVADRASSIAYWSDDDL